VGKINLITMTYLKEILLIALPILVGLTTATMQRVWLRYKTNKFKLTDHPLFTDLSTSISELYSWQPKESRVVFIDALRIKFRAWKIGGLELATTLQKNAYSNTQLKNTVIIWATDTVNTYTKSWEETGIPPKVIGRISEIHQEKVEQFIQEVKNITYNNDMYPFKMQKCIAIFDLLRLLLSDTKNDFNRLIHRERYNGAFKGCLYKKVPLNDDEYKEYLLKLE